VFLNDHQKLTREEMNKAGEPHITAEMLEEYFREILHIIDIHILCPKP